MIAQGQLTGKGAWQTWLSPSADGVREIGNGVLFLGLALGFLIGTAPSMDAVRQPETQQWWKLRTAIGIFFMIGGSVLGWFFIPAAIKRCIALPRTGYTLIKIALVLAIGASVAISVVSLLVTNTEYPVPLSPEAIALLLVLPACSAMLCRAAGSLRTRLWYWLLPALMLLGPLGIVLVAPNVLNEQQCLEASFLSLLWFVFGGVRLASHVSHS